MLTGCPGSKGGKQTQGPDLGTVYSYTYGKIRVIQQYSDRAYVHFRLYVDGGTDNYAAGTAGIESLAIETALYGGAGDLDAAAYAAAVEAAGAQLGYATTPDYSVLTLDCLPDNAEAAWDLFVAALKTPTFDPAVYEGFKTQRLALLEGEGRRPERKAMAMARAQAFGETAYGWPSEGTADNIRNLGPGKVRKHFVKKLMHKCRLTLVVVGPLDGEAIADLMLRGITGLPEGDCPEARAPQEAPRSGRIATDHRELATQYMVGVVPAPPAGSPDVTPMRVALALAQQRISEKLVAMNALRYGPEIDYHAFRQGYATIDFSSHKALRCAELILSELRQIREKGFGEAEWATARAQLSTRAYLRAEDAPSIGQALGHMALLGEAELPGVRPDPAKIRKKDLDAVVRKYWTGISWAYIGDTTRMDRKTLLRF